MGGNWFGGNWFGGNWFGGNWSGGSGGGGSPVFAMRADRPLAEVAITRDYYAKFRDSEWDPDLRAIAIMPEFLAQTIGGKQWQAAVALPPPTYPVTANMIDEVQVLAVAERPEALGEIVEENQNFQLRWLQLLNITATSHPQTFLLMKIMARVGEFAMVQLKLQYPNRAGAAPPPYWYQPRPSQVCPTLYPPVQVPGHPAYPAGHALIGTLTSECLADMLPQYTEALRALAARVGMNRMIAGLHYREDIDAGARAAVALKPYLTACPFYAATLKLAKTEWQ
ncbi:PA-phosphatase [Bradyrhizobium sp. CB1717]|uniref:PA-phosphatase n=1 Tax=Bradyrhizobium sp. CB1717 TaxID=3039154 RepID=UPI0024B0E7F4|nr:PA-phosphatase [Bradyrhizobium sp. CB1717]WFU21548.1 PA-phosphatase [Bradyrhizobium sp. CB1717]